MSRFKLAQSFPLNETTTVAGLANACGMHEADAMRVVRHAVMNRIFLEPRKGVIAHSALSKTIAENPLLQSYIEECCTHPWPAATRAVDAMERWPGSEEPNETAFNLLKGTEDTFFAALSKDVMKSKRFADCMALMQASPGMHTVYTIDHYDWQAHGAGLVVDVGGSHGLVAYELARRFPSMRCIVQDLPEVIAAAPRSEDPELASRVEFHAHDFFAEQPVTGADVYFLRMILHDWGDKYAVRILRSLIPALKKGARVVVNEHVVPESGALGIFQERSLLAFDWVMKQQFNAKERDLGEWRDLFEKADPRFRVGDVVVPRDSELQIIEVIWDD